MRPNSVLAHLSTWHITLGSLILWDAACTMIPADLYSEIQR